MPSNFPNHSAEQIRTNIRRSADTLQSFGAAARVSVKSPKKSHSFDAKIRQERSDSLLVRVSLFGIEGGRLLLTRDSVFFYNKRKNVVRVGPISDAQALFPVPVASEHIFANMLGLIAPGNPPKWQVESDSSFYYLTDPSKTRHWVVDPTRWRVIRYTRESEDGTVLEKRHFSNFKTVNQVSVPHQVIFRRPPDNLMGRIQYRKIRLNPSGLSFQLGAPARIPRKPLR